MDDFFLETNRIICNAWRPDYCPMCDGPCPNDLPRQYWYVMSSGVWWMDAFMSVALEPAPDGGRAWEFFDWWGPFTNPHEAWDFYQSLPGIFDDIPF